MSKQYFVKRYTMEGGNVVNAADVDVPEYVWLRIGQMLADEIKKGSAHFVVPAKPKKTVIAK